MLFQSFCKVLRNQQKVNACVSAFSCLLYVCQDQKLGICSSALKSWMKLLRSRLASKKSTSGQHLIPGPKTSNSTFKNAHCSHWTISSKMVLSMCFAQFRNNQLYQPGSQALLHSEIWLPACYFFCQHPRLSLHMSVGCISIIYIYIYYVFL